MAEEPAGRVPKPAAAAAAAAVAVEAVADGANEVSGATAAAADGMLSVVCLRFLLDDAAPPLGAVFLVCSTTTTG
jgi:hypothetical protein